jgi:hypothetical protein
MIGAFRRSSERISVSWEIGMVGYAMDIEVVYLRTEEGVGDVTSSDVTEHLLTVLLQHFAYLAFIMPPFTGLFFSCSNPLKGIEYPSSLWCLLGCKIFHTGQLEA